MVSLITSNRAPPVSVLTNHRHSSTPRARAQPITCLVIGLILFPLFFYYESRLPSSTALIPSSIWHIQNVTILVVVSLVPYFWWYGIQYCFANIMQEDWGVSSIMTAVHLYVPGSPLYFER